MLSGSLRIGVDLGGTKTEAVVVRVGILDDVPQIVARRRIPTLAERGYEAIVTQTCGLIKDVARDAVLDEASLALVPIGIGMPGSVTTRRADGTRSEVQLVKNSNTTCLNGRAFRADLSRALGRTDVAFANDANCFALAEATFGAARDARVTFGVIVGTGVGGGIAIRDPGQAPPRTWEGAQGIAGEWGHVVLDSTAGPPCYCGHRGCIETYLAGPAIERDYAARARTSRSVAEIARLANEGDAVARALLAERMDLFGRALSVVVNVLDPDVVVLGGGVSNLDALYHDGTEALRRWIFNDEVRTRVVRNELGDSAGVLGAALLGT